MNRLIKKLEKIGRDPKVTAKAAGLRYVTDSMPGYTRKKLGKGFGFYDADGKPVKDKELTERFTKLVIPPAYTNVWISPYANGHLQFTGTDAAGRKQYRYHPDYRTHQEAEKFDRTAEFGGRLPKLRKRVEKDLAGDTLSRERAIASVVRLLDLGAVRVGNESYARSNKSFGATTLRMRHVTVSGKTVKLRFKAKSGKLCEVAVTDLRLAHFVRKMDDLPGQNLFQYIGDDDEVHAVGSAEVNDYLCETMGEHFTAKNFRTWHASAIAFGLLAKADGQLSIKALMEEVSDKLGNTPAIARKSYVHPAVVALVERQAKWRKGLKLPRKTRWLSREERGLLELLKSGPGAAKLLAGS